MSLCAGALSLGARLEAARADEPRRKLETTLEATVVASGGRPGWAWIELARASPASGAEPAPARVLVSGPLAPERDGAWARALPGERIRAHLRLAAPRPAQNPGSRSERRRLARAGVGAVGRAVHPSLFARLPEREGWRPLAALHRVRRQGGEALAALGPGGALLRALALGDRRDLSERSRDAFTRLGLAHLLAVSGLHLGLLAAAVFAAARRVLARVPGLAARRDVRPAALLCALAAALAYALLAGWGVPVRRAWVMLLALVGSLALSRAGSRGSPLAAAAIAVLALEPGALFAAGAQLSFAATAGLAWALGAEPAARRTWRARLEPGLRASAVAVAVTGPLIAWHGGAVAPAALAANAVAVPWTACVLLPASLAAGVAEALADGHAVAGACERIAAWTLRTVEVAADALPARSPASAPGAPALALAVALAALALRASRTRVRIACALGVSAVLAGAPPPALSPPAPRLVALAVGQGNALLVQGRGASVLVDAGTRVPGGADLGRRRVVPALAALGVRSLALVIASHADLDHRGGLPAVLSAFRVGAVWIPVGGRADPDFAELLETARARAVPVLERGAGSPVARLGDLSVTPLWPPPDHRASRNDRSLVVRIEAGGRRVLLPGDLERAGEAALLAAGVDVKADVLVLPHHGSRSSSSPAFLEAVGAAVAIASAACAARSPIPHPEVLARVRAAGAASWWTGRDGAVFAGLAPPLTVRGFGPGRRDCGQRPQAGFGR